GIAVCNVNKISKTKAHSFAEYLHSNFPLVRETFKEKSDLLNAIKLLANLYDLNISDSIVEATLQELLEKYDNLTKSYDPTERLIQLAPTCQDVLLKCKWGGIEYDCHEIIFSRITFDGICCIFNYIRPIGRPKVFKKLNKNNNLPFEARNGMGSGPKKGLQLVMKDTSDDYFVTTTDIRGYVVSIFNPMDFPDKNSGSLSEVMANVGTEVFIGIKVSITNPNKAIRILPTRMRKCIFHDELHTDFGNYRHSDCLASCKMHAMKMLCQCIPFSQPVDDYNYCTLTDLPCLSNFYRKWTSYYPENEDSPALNFERENSIDCRHCFSVCKDQTYFVSVDVLPIAINPTNITYVNVFFERSFGDSLKIDLVQYWYELVSSCGGFISLLMGLSFISFAEMFVLMYKLVVFCLRKRKQSKIFGVVTIVKQTGAAVVPTTNNKSKAELYRNNYVNFFY
ncbi:unnamed protein product, partial [Psylliodes chrysocephalus]